MAWLQCRDLQKATIFTTDTAVQIEISTESERAATHHLTTLSRAPGFGGTEFFVRYAKRMTDLDADSKPCIAVSATRPRDPSRSRLRVTGHKGQAANKSLMLA
jgi:hypothetical protein